MKKTFIKMGNCSTHPAPGGNFCFAQNAYQNSNGERPGFSDINLPNFCTYEGVAGDKYRDKYCSNIDLNQGEWVSDGSSLLCYYNDSHPYIDYGFGCCNGSCGIFGKGAACKRTGKYNGDPVTCCFNSFLCGQGNPQLYHEPTEQSPEFAGCFSDEAQTKTCEYSTWDITSNVCQQNILNYCSGQDSIDNIYDKEWLNRWDSDMTNDNCLNAMLKNTFNMPGTGGTGSQSTLWCNVNASTYPDFGNNPINASGLFWSKQLMIKVFEHYKLNGFVLGSLPNQNTYSPFQDTIYNICNAYPEFCSDGLSSYCSDFTADQISKNFVLSNWCGCHLNNSEYELYSEKYNVGFECTPMCNRNGVIPMIGVGAKPILCTKNICIMDDITVNIVNSQIVGSVDFTDLCGNCDSCSCFIDNNQIDIENSKILGNVNIAENNCGTQNSFCSNDNESQYGPVKINSLCGSQNTNIYSNYETNVLNEQKKTKFMSFMITFSIIGILIFLILLILLI
jgi:hypothetical protein